MNQVRSVIFPASLLLMFVFCFYPALSILMKKWWGSEDYTHAIFVVPIIAYIVWQKRDHFFDRSASNWVGGGLVLLSLLYYLLSLKIQVPTLIFLSFVFFFISVVVFIGGVGAVKDFLLPAFLMLMIIPIPNQILSTITASMQLYISELSEHIIRLFSVPMLREGNVLQLPTRSFQVIDACSGIRSLISMTTLSVIIGYFTLSRNVSKVALFFISIPVAMVMNLVRVVAIVLLYYFFRLDLTAGMLHSATGLVLFVAGLAMLFTFQRFLEQWEIKKINK